MFTVLSQYCKSEIHIDFEAISWPTLVNKIFVTQEGYYIIRYSHMLTGTGIAAVDGGSHINAVANSLETGTPLARLPFIYLLFNGHTSP